MEAGGFLEQGFPPSIIKLYKEWPGKFFDSTFLLVYTNTKESQRSFIAFSNNIFHEKS